ncbi:hypothetical protein [Pseudomonas sp. ZB1P45]|uniref:hypothetical protein n=1 Tax=Pseudomonas frigoris TaxID=3398356 RepID=UPI0039F0DA29
MSLPKKWLAFASLTACLLGVQHAQANEPLLYTVSATQALPGEGYSWGFGALEPVRPYLFIARRENGLSVFNVEQ